MAAAKSRKVLIIRSSGGGGCIQAAIAKEQEERAKNADVVIIHRDIMKDWYIKAIGKFGVNIWNFAQRTGRVALLEFLQKGQPIGDLLFWPQYFYLFFTTIWKEDIDHVIDVQPQGTSAFLLALRCYNRLRRKKVVLEKVVVDLPTERNTHFFRPIKHLSKKNRQLLRMVTIPPLLKKGQTVENFWRQNCNLSESEVIYQKYVVRQAFLSFQNRERKHEEFSIQARFNHPGERNLLQRSIQRGPLRAEFGEGHVRFFIDPQDKVIAILLGSQPAFNGTIEYVRRFLQLANEPQASRTPVHLFVFCSSDKTGENSLLQEISDLVVKTQNYPSHMTVVPIGFQKEDTVASVFFRSNLTCTRSAGQTAMELMCVMKGEIWIHSETKKPLNQSSDLTLEQLLRGIPGWESGAALYLHQLWNAKIVTPDTFIPHGRKILSV